MIPVGGYINMQQRYLFYKKEGTEEVRADVWDSEKAYRELSVVCAGTPANEADETEVRQLTEDPGYVPRLKLTDNPQRRVIHFEKVSAEKEEWTIKAQKNVNYDPTSTEAFFLSSDFVLIFEKNKRVDLWNLNSNQIRKVEDVNVSNLDSIEYFHSNLFILYYKQNSPNDRCELYSFRYGAFKQRVSWNLPSQLGCMCVVSENNISTACLIEGNLKIYSITVDGTHPQIKKSPIFDMPCKDVKEMKGFKGCYRSLDENNKIRSLYSRDLNWSRKSFIQDVKPYGLLLGRKAYDDEGNVLDKEELLFINAECKEVLIENSVEIPSNSRTCTYLPKKILMFFYKGALHAWNAVTGKYIKSIKVSEQEDCESITALDNRFIALTYFIGNQRRFVIYDCVKAPAISKKGMKNKSSGEDKEMKSLSPLKEIYIAFETNYDSKIPVKVFSLEKSFAIIADGEIQVIVPPVEKTNLLLRKEFHFWIDLFRGKAYQHKVQSLHGNKNKTEKYHLYMTGFVTYLKAEKFGLARKFFGKARHLQPDSDEPFNWLQLLGISPKEKLYYDKQKGLSESQNSASSSSPNPIIEPPAFRLRKRLYVGEGNFTGVEAIVKKHKSTTPSLPKAIIATELVPACEKNTKDRVDELKKLGVVFDFETDGTKIHQKFKKKRFERIQWNCPHAGRDLNNYLDYIKLKQIIRDFFASASALQIAGDRVQLVLFQERTCDDFYQKRQARDYGIIPAATKSNYRLIGKRRFDEGRYPEYVHQMNDSRLPLDGKKSEFVFEKIDDITVKEIRSSFSKPKSSLVDYEMCEREGIPVEKEETSLMDETLSIEGLARKFMDPNQKEYTVEKCYDGHYYECSTDNESSDYETDDATESK